MRIIPAQALQEMQKHFGTEPIFILEVAWSLSDNVRIAYSDQKINGLDYPHPSIITLSNLDITMKLMTGSQASDSQSITVTLDDFDGCLKTIVDSQDIHMRPCWLYQSFQGLDQNQKFLIFKGHIVTPINWSEGERTLTFDITTKRTDVELAFSMEEGDFPNIPSDALGKVWPLVFGTVCNMEAINVRSPRKGYLAFGEGIRDYTLEPRLCQARNIQCPNVSSGTNQVLKTTESTVNKSDTYQPVPLNYEGAPDPTCVQDRIDTICELTSLLNQELSYEHSTLTITGGDKFPQNQLVTININGAIFTGTFLGTIFTVATRLHPDLGEIDPVTGKLKIDSIDPKTQTSCTSPLTYQQELACKPVADRTFSHKPTHATKEWTRSTSGTSWRWGTQGFESSGPNENCNSSCETSQQTDGGPTESQKAYDDMPSGNFCWLPAGTEVFLVSEAEILYIVSLIPGVINNVAAYYKQVATGREILMSIPTTYYTTYETNYIGYTVTEIGFAKPISQIDSNWGDNIYVSFTSDVGPNPCDIIEWLVNKYTSLQIDITSFNHVKTRLTNYPTNFYIKTKETVLKTIQDIAYQSRCAIYIRNDILYIIYLAEEPTSVRTLTVSDIVANTFQLQYLESEDLVTKYTAKWKKSDASIINSDSVDRSIILKNNINKYGTFSYNYDYYTQNTYETVLKSATFWLIRLSNTWKTVKFDTPLTMLDLDVFDCITIDSPHLASTPVKVIITTAQYDNTTNTIHFECLTPIRSGETSPYLFFWPADIDPKWIFPLPTDAINAGAGVSFQVTPPVGHILRGGDTNQPDSTRIIASSGDPHPSDLDDSYPILICDISSIIDVVEPDPVITALNVAKSANQKAISNAMNSGAGNKNDQNEKKDSGCGGDSYTGCSYTVTVAYVTPRWVAWKKTKDGGCGGPCGCGGKGTVCIGGQTQMCHTFGSLYGASLFASQKRSEAMQLQKCGYTCGKTDIYWVMGPRAWGKPNPGDAPCEDPHSSKGNPNDGKDQGQINKPAAMK